MTSFFDNFQNTLNELKNILGYLIVGIVLAILLVMCIKNKNFAKVLVPIMFVVIVITGIVSAVQLHDTLDLESKEIGTAIHLQEDDYNSISRFEFGVIELETNDDTTYKNIRSFSSEDFYGTNKNYSILFNDKLCDNVVTKAGSVEGVLVLNFYDTDGAVITTAKMNILIEYLDKETKVSTSIVNTNYSVSYLTSYMELHGVVIEVVE